MPWLGSLLAALALLCGISGGNRLQRQGFANAYDEEEAASNMNVATYVQRCSRYLNAAPGVASTEQRLPPECLDDANEEVSRDANGNGNGAMLSALFGPPQTTPALALPPPTAPAQLPPHQLPPMYYNDFYEDLLATKRNDVHSAGCDCKVTNELVDLGNQHFPRYLMNAVCESRQSGRHETDAKCTHGANCKPLEYKVKVLTLGVGAEAERRSASLFWLPEDMSQLWKFKTVTVTAGCFCAK